jgi:hypothetical protein
MANTPNMKVALVEAAQYQKEVTISTGFSAFDTLAGVVEKVATGGTVNLTEAEARAAYIYVTGSPGGSTTFVVPSTLSKATTFINATADHSSIIAKVGAGGTPSAAILWGSSLMIWPTGTASVGGGSAATAATLSASSGSLASLATGNFTVAMGKTGLLLKLTVDADCWLRGYQTSAARTADAGRVAGTPTPIDEGCVFDYIFTGVTSFVMAPAIVYNNMDTVRADAIYCSLVNNSGGVHTFPVDFMYLKMEA